MKVFQLVGTYDWPMNRRQKDYVVLLGTSDRITEADFQAICRQIANKLKKKYNAGDTSVPNKDRKSREQIIDEIAEELKQSGYDIITIAGRHTIEGFLPK